MLKKIKGALRFKRQHRYVEKNMVETKRPQNCNLLLTEVTMSRGQIFLTFEKHQGLKISHLGILVSKENKIYELAFKQEGNQIILEQLDLYKVAQEGKHVFRIFYENDKKAYTMQLIEKHQEIKYPIVSENPLFDEFILSFYSNMNKNLTLEVKTLERQIIIDAYSIDSNQIFLYSHLFSYFSSNYQLTLYLERYGQLYELDFEINDNEISASSSPKLLSQLACGFDYKLQIGLNQGEKYFHYTLIDSTTQKCIEVSLNQDNLLVPFFWGSSLNIVYIDGEKTVLSYDKSLNLEQVYLEYKERPVYKTLSLENNKAIFKNDYSTLNSVYKAVHTIYQDETGALWRSKTEINRLIEHVESRKDLEIIAFLTKVGTKMVSQNTYSFKTLRAINVIDVEIQFKGNVQWIPVTFTAGNKEFSIQVSNQSQIDSIYVYYQEGKQEFESCSKFDEIFVGEELQ